MDRFVASTDPRWRRQRPNQQCRVRRLRIRLGPRRHVQPARAALGPRRPPGPGRMAGRTAAGQAARARRDLPHPALHAVAASELAVLPTPRQHLEGQRPPRHRRVRRPLRRRASPGQTRRSGSVAWTPQLKLEMQYALQCRHDERQARLRPTWSCAWCGASPAAGDVSARPRRAGLAERIRPVINDTRCARPVSLYAYRSVADLAEAGGWEAEYPRDVWRMRRLGLRRRPHAALRPASPSPGCASWPNGGPGGGCPPGWAWKPAAADRSSRSPASPGSSPRRRRPRSARSTGRCWNATWPTCTPTLTGAQRQRQPHRSAERVLHRDPPAPLGQHASRPTRCSSPRTSQARERLPRALAEHVMAQLEHPANLDRWNNPAYRLVTVILMRCGLRITDALRLRADCVVADADGAPYLRYFNHKMKREALVPIDEELARLIGEQQPTLRERWPGGHAGGCSRGRPRTSTAPADRQPHLPAGAAAAGWNAATSATSTASPSHLTPHQWRHTLGTRLINRDVPQEVVRRILDHDSPQMTGALRPAARHHRPPALGSRPQGQHQRRDSHPRPGRAARRGRLGQAAARPRHPGPAQRLLRAARAEDLPARQRLPDLPDVHHHPRVPAPAPRAAPADPADHHRRRGPRPAAAGRDEPAGARQPRQHHHRPADDTAERRPHDAG